MKFNNEVLNIREAIIMNHRNEHLLTATKKVFICPHYILKYLTRSWVLVALLGQWIFALYIFVKFGMPALSGNLTSATTSAMIKGYINGNDFGNGVLLLHLLPAIWLSFGGIFQLIPYLRKKFPVFHRWNGRIFLTLGLFGSLTGLYLLWGLDARFSNKGSIGITINGLLILLAVAQAWRFAITRQYQKHMRWAIHAFILINGVWSVRLYMMGWFMLNQGANGNTSKVDGPADIAISFASYLFPMLVAEIYFWAMRQKSTYRVTITNLFMLFGLLITIIGIVAATTMMWWPRIMA